MEAHPRAHPNDAPVEDDVLLAPEEPLCTDADAPGVSYEVMSGLRLSCARGAPLSCRLKPEVLILGSDVDEVIVAFCIESVPLSAIEIPA